MPLVEPTATPRARPVTFILPDEAETEVTIPPVSIAQACAALRLDPKAGRVETEAQGIIRLHDQAKILLGADFAHLTDVLNPAQMKLVVDALYIAAVGLDAESFHRWHLAKDKASYHRTAAEMLRQMELLTIELAAELGKLPSEVAQTALADAVALQKLLRERAAAEIEFQAAIHGAARK